MSEPNQSTLPFLRKRRSGDVDLPQVKRGKNIDMEDLPPTPNTPRKTRPPLCDLQFSTPKKPRTPMATRLFSSSRTHSASETPRTSRTQRILRTPKMQLDLETSKTPSTPKTARTLGTLGTAVTPKPSTPKTLKTLSTLTTSRTQSALGTPRTPKTPSTPRTPRTQSALGTSGTPKTPSTPRTRRALGTSGTHKTPSTKTPVTPRTSYTPLRECLAHLTLSTREALADTKHSLSQGYECPLVCREKEIAAISDYLTSHLSSHTPGALYVSGLPGTGKSACLKHVLQIEEVMGLKTMTKVIKLNCNGVKTPNDIYIKLAKQLLPGIQCIGRVDELKVKLTKVMMTSEHMIVLILDEIDRLDNAGHKVLYSLFDWPMRPNSKLILIGIANVLDFTSRVLPHLRMSVPPKLINFLPYNVQQLAVILAARIKDGGSCRRGGTAIIDSRAVQYCARKVAAVHGDVRRALDICRMAVESLEDELCLLEAKENQPLPNSICVTLRHMAAVISKAYSSDISIQTLGETLPLHQQLVIAALLRLQGGRTQGEVDVKKLNNAYVNICMMRKVPVQQDGDFRDMLNMLEGRGVFIVKKEKGGNLQSKVKLRLSSEELGNILKEEFITSIFS